MRSRIVFSSPPENDVVIFDADGSALIEKTILRGIPFSVLHGRFERFYLSPKILLLMFLNLRLVDLSRCVTLKKILGQIYRVYLYSCLEHMSPKVVLTWIEDSAFFHFLSRKYMGPRFYGISNGFRYEYPVVVGPGDYRNSMPDMVCFGRFEADLYKRYGHEIDRFHAVGSVQAGYFKEGNVPPIPLPDFDLCLVSQAVPEIMYGEIYPEIKAAVRGLDERLSRYVREKGVRLAVALRSRDEREKQYFRSVYGDSLIMVENDRAKFSTYQAMDKSPVVVVFDSTAAVEAYGWGKKVLFSNYSGTTRFRIPVADACLADGCAYEEYAAKLDAIRRMSDAEYHVATGENRKYLITWDQEMLAHNYVRGLVEAAIRPAA